MLKTTSVALALCLSAGCAADVADDPAAEELREPAALYASNKTVNLRVSPGESVYKDEYYGFGKIRVTLMTTGTPTTGFPMRGAAVQVKNESGTPIKLTSYRLKLDCDGGGGQHTWYDNFPGPIEGGQLVDLRRRQCPAGTLIAAEFHGDFER